LLYTDRELHLHIDEKLFGELQCQIQEFIKGDLIQPSHKGRRRGEAIEKSHGAEKLNNFNTKHPAKDFTMAEKTLKCFQYQKSETEMP
jgi:hypothetical protein